MQPPRSFCSILCHQFRFCVAKSSSLVLLYFTERERRVSFFSFVCQWVFLFLFIFSFCCEKNAGSEKGDELEKGGEGPLSSHSSCLAFHLYSSPCSQAWPFCSLLMVVSFILYFIYTLCFLIAQFRKKWYWIKGSQQNSTLLWFLFWIAISTCLPTWFVVNLFSPFDFHCMQMVFLTISRFLFFFGKEIGVQSRGTCVDVFLLIVIFLLEKQLAYLIWYSSVVLSTFFFFF